MKSEERVIKKKFGEKKRGGEMKTKELTLMFLYLHIPFREGI